MAGTSARGSGDPSRIRSSAATPRDAGSDTGASLKISGSADAPYRVMTVCTGNICRSPIAEVVLRDRFEAAGLGDRVVVDSGGTSSEELGNPVDPRAARVLREAGYAVPDRTAHQVTRDDLAHRDLVLAMTAQHARRLRTMAPQDAGEIRMYRSFDPSAPSLERVDESALDVEDPWYGGHDDFLATLDQVEAAADAVVEHVRRALG